MTREKAIKIATSLRADFEWGESDNMVDFCNTIIKALEQEPRWVPVSERLPEFCKEVLTCGNGGFIEIQSLEDSYDGYWENQKGDWSEIDEVIAWMPLPQSYTESEE